MKPIFITGIGTGVGKTVVSTIVTEALQADYWKPVQAGFDEGTDALKIQQLITNTRTIIHPEVYKLSLAASPHIAAREEGISISIDKITNALGQLTSTNNYVVIEGAGGLLVPLNEDEFVIDLIGKLGASIILVSRNYLGSINHSLLTAALCKQRKLDVLGWIFNDQYLNYEDEIVKWSGYQSLGSLPLMEAVNREQVLKQAELFRETIISKLRISDTEDNSVGQ